MEDQCAVILGA